MIKFHMEKISFFIFSASWHGVKLKITLGKFIDQLNSLQRSLIWSRDFALPVYLFHRIRINHDTKVMTTSNVSFCQELLLVQIPTSYHMLEFRFLGVYTSSYSANHIYTKSFTYKRLTVVSPSIVSFINWSSV